MFRKKARAEMALYSFFSDQRGPTRPSTAVNAISKLNKVNKAELLQESYYGDNLLIITIRFHNSWQVKEVLKLMQDLSHEVRGIILSYASWHTKSALMYAAQCNPEAVKPLLNAMQDLSPEMRGNILSQVDNEGCNALMMAARYNGEFIKPLLDAMQDLSPEVRKNILSKADYKRMNALMLALIYQLEFVKPLLNAIQYLEKTSIDKIFNSKNYFGLNVIEVARRDASPECEELLEQFCEKSHVSLSLEKPPAYDEKTFYRSEFFKSPKPPSYDAVLVISNHSSQFDSSSYST